MGEAIVKPNRLRKAANSKAGTERSFLNSFENLFGDLDCCCCAASSSLFAEVWCSVVRRRVEKPHAC